MGCSSDLLLSSLPQETWVDGVVIPVGYGAAGEHVNCVQVPADYPQHEGDCFSLHNSDFFVGQAINFVRTFQNNVWVAALLHMSGIAQL